MDPKVVLYCLPDRFYWESSTSMGTLYSTEHRRWSWSDVESAIRTGLSVEIKPPTAALWEWAEAELAAVKAAMEKTGGTRNDDRTLSG